jgi:hypothetical protein
MRAQPSSRSGSFKSAGRGYPYDAEQRPDAVPVEKGGEPVKIVPIHMGRDVVDSEGYFHGLFPC